MRETTMTKWIAFGVAVLFCVAAAGFGAYIAMRPRATVVSAPEPGVSVSQELAEAGATAQTPPVTTTENVVTDTALTAAPAAGLGSAAPGTGSPGSQPAPAASASPHGGASGSIPAPASSRSTSSSNTPAGGSAVGAGSVAGAGQAAPPASQNAGWTGIDKPSPSGNATSIPPVPTTADPTPVAEPVAPPPPPGPPPRTFEELVVTADSVLGLQVDSTVSSEVARVEDPVEARVTRDVRVGSDVAIPSGTRVIGSVVQVERGGKMKTKARIGIRFHTLVLSDGTRLRMSTEAVYREGQSPGQESAAKVGAAAVGGAILGAIIGGGKGAAIGGSVGAAGGTAAVMAGGRNPAVLNSGTAVTVRLREPVTVVVERNEYRD